MSFLLCNRVVVASLMLASLCGCGIPSLPIIDEPMGVEPAIAHGQRNLTPPITTPVSFKPPNPDRTNPFSIADAQVNDSSDNLNQGNSPRVVVYGFANVSGERAVLLIDGRRCTLAVNERINGVQVVKIDPPSVTLQTGNFLWTASMFDQSH